MQLSSLKYSNYFSRYKYLVNYLYWMKWLEYFKDDKEVLKGKNLLLQTVSSQVELNIEDYKVRTVSFV